MINIEEYLNSLSRRIETPTLKTMKWFMESYDNFEKEMRFIHIAGTNGKGSCTEILNNVLVKQGYKVGKFISPHLIKYNERISINGKDISDEEMSNLIEELAPKIDSYREMEKVQITFFEVITMIAVLYFYRNNVDFTILEVGMGGNYDATNVITNPLVSIITSVGYDHMEWLGNTLEKISYEKAGIIKENSHTVKFVQSDDIDDVFKNVCKMKNNTLHLIQNSQVSKYSFDEKLQHFDYNEFKNLSINLKGKKQVENTCVCIETLKILDELGYKIDFEKIKEGLSTVIHRGRMEELCSFPKIIYDGAHNEPAIRNLQANIKDYYGDSDRIYIVSILKRKDYKKMLEILAEDEKATVILTSGNDPTRYTDKDELYDCMKKLCSEEKLMKMELKEAIRYVMESEKDTVSFVIGSLYTYGTVRDEIKLNK